MSVVFEVVWWIWIWDFERFKIFRVLHRTHVDVDRRLREAAATRKITMPLVRVQRWSIVTPITRSEILIIILTPTQSEYIGLDDDTKFEIG